MNYFPLFALCEAFEIQGVLYPSQRISVRTSPRWSARQPGVAAGDWPAQGWRRQTGEAGGRAQMTSAGPSQLPASIFS